MYEKEILDELKQIKDLLSQIKIAITEKPVDWENFESNGPTKTLYPMIETIDEETDLL